MSSNRTSNTQVVNRSKREISASFISGVSPVTNQTMPPNRGTPVSLRHMHRVPTSASAGVR